MELQKYSIGGIKFLLIFKAFKLNHLQKELDFYKSNFPNNQTHVSINFVEDIKKLGIIKGNETYIDNSTYFYKSGLFVGKDYYYMIRYPFSSIVKRKGNNYEIFISKKSPCTLIEKFHKNIVRSNLLSPSFIKDEERLASNIIYDFINPFLQLKLLDNKGTFVHASCVSDGKEALIMPAWGGVGKTSLSSNFILKNNFKFISDDLAILRNKKVYVNLTHLFVYPYNKNLLSQVKLSSLNKLKWNFYRALRVPPLRIRKSPIEVYGKDNIEYEPQKINKIFFLEKGNFKSFYSAKTNYSLIKSKMKNILLDEFKSLVELIIFVNSISSGILPSLEDFLKKINSSIEYNLKGVNTKIIKVPMEKINSFEYVSRLYWEK